jgi:hypothetical protein
MKLLSSHSMPYMPPSKSPTNHLQFRKLLFLFVTEILLGYYIMIKTIGYIVILQSVLSQSFE